MTPIKPETKAKAASISKATARGPAATAGWGYIIWILLVDKNHVLVPKGGVPDSFTNFEVGLIAVVWCGLLRALEAKWPWFGTLLLSQGPPSYQRGDDTDTPPAEVIDVQHGETNVHIEAPGAPVPPLTSNGGVFLGGGSLSFAPDSTVRPPGVVTALDDPHSLDTSLVPISADPDDLLEGH